jgi:hypothetical protein
VYRTGGADSAQPASVIAITGRAQPNRFRNIAVLSEEQQRAKQPPQALALFGRTFPGIERKLLIKLMAAVGLLSTR